MAKDTVSTGRARRKYRFADRADAEAAYEAAEGACRDAMAVVSDELSGRRAGLSVSGQYEARLYRLTGAQGGLIALRVRQPDHSWMLSSIQTVDAFRLTWLRSGVEQGDRDLYSIAVWAGVERDAAWRAVRQGGAA